MISTRPHSVVSRLSTLLLFSLGVPSSLPATLINGAGATFPYPIYSKWFSDYQKKNPEAQFNYQSIGSGGGIRQFTDHTIDFGATDSPMTDEQLKKAGAAVLHIPTVLGAVVVSYNLPGTTSPLKLSGDVVADIFLGKITKWSDPRIASVNPGNKLAGDILVVHRSDGSGTSFVFTDYLSKVSPEWLAKAGRGTAVQWPTGLGGKGNEGVAGLIKQNPGSIGYVELIYAEQNGLSHAVLKNSAGKFVAASVASVTVAAEGQAIPDDFRVSLTDPKGPKAYPLSSFTYLLIWKQNTADPLVTEKATLIKQFIGWAVTEGQKSAADLHYAPLPKKIAQRVLTLVRPGAKLN